MNSKQLKTLAILILVIISIGVISKINDERKKQSESQKEGYQTLADPESMFNATNPLSYLNIAATVGGTIYFLKISRTILHIVWDEVKKI